MFSVMLDYAKEVKIKGFTAEILATNIRMLNIFHRSGLRIETRMVDDVIEVKAEF
jgi:hypothetical protein